MGVPPAEAIRAAKDRLATAYFGLEDMQKRPDRYLSGLMNAVIFGRMVNFSLQNMRNEVEGWEEWYAPKQVEMKNDPLMVYFLNLRNKFEKQTHANPAVRGEFNFSPEMRNSLEPKPPGATAFVFGHAKHGGASGWVIPLDGGEEQFYAVQLPQHIADFRSHMPDAPEMWRGNTTDEMVVAYLQKLRDLISEVEARFAP